MPQQTKTATCCERASNDIVWLESPVYVDTPGWNLLGGSTQDGDDSYVDVAFCPWCGTKLPKEPAS